MNLLLHALGEPQNAIPSVHIAGTKGKGSTSEIVAAGIRALYGKQKYAYSNQ